MDNNKFQANPNYVIEELTAQNAMLNQELAMYKAIIREQAENENKDNKNQNSAVEE